MYPHITSRHQRKGWGGRGARREPSVGKEDIYKQCTRTSLVITKGRGEGEGGPEESQVRYKRCLLIVLLVVVHKASFYHTVGTKRFSPNPCGKSFEGYWILKNHLTIMRKKRCFATRFATHCNSLQLNYNLIKTTHFQLLFNSIIITPMMSCWCH